MTEQITTKRILIDTCSDTIEGTIDANADIDSRFVVTEDDGNKLAINGWLFNSEVELIDGVETLVLYR